VRNESIMWKKLRPVLLAAKLDPVRVENPIYPGTPDVNLAIGSWIELKYLAALPRPGCLLRIPHFTNEQRVWLYRRWRYAPGTTFLLLEIRAEHQWLLFDGDVAKDVVGCSTYDQHHAKSRAVLGERELARLPKILVELPKILAEAGGS
jgi:hypothetical protein